MGTTEIIAVGYHKLANILTQDAEFAKDIKSKEGRFIQELGLLPSEMDQTINNCRNEIVSVNELTTGVLRKWHSRRGKEATVGVLCMVLRRISFVALAGITLRSLVNLVIRRGIEIWKLLNRSTGAGLPARPQLTMKHGEDITRFQQSAWKFKLATYSAALIDFTTSDAWNSICKQEIY